MSSKRIVSALFLALLLFCSTSAYSQGDPDKKEEVDLTPLVDYLSDYLYRTDRPYYIYNWFRGQGAWQNHFKSDDPLVLDHATRASQSYWREKPNGGGGNMFGYGLYASTDPVTTSNFGGGPGNWVLLEMKLPAGFRMLDLSRDGRNAFPAEVAETLKEVGCPANWANSTNAITSMLNMSPTPKCSEAIQKVLRDRLKVDGFAYSYGASYISECKGRNHQVAFVITESRWLNRDRVRIYNEKSTGDSEQRKRIQGLFSNSGYYTAWQLWPDIDKKVAPKDLDQWIQNNLYGCKSVDRPPYISQRSFEKKLSAVRPCDTALVDALPDVPLQDWFESLKKASLTARAGDSASKASGKAPGTGSDSNWYKTLYGNN